MSSRDYTPWIDWRDAKAYPSREQPLTRWYWEFLRRNPEYRSFWTFEHARFSKEYKKSTGAKPSPEKIIPGYTLDNSDMIQAWGFAPLTNPDGDQVGTKWGIPTSILWNPKSNLVDGNGWSNQPHVLWPIRPGRIVVDIDTDLPLNRQLDAVKAALQAGQDRLGFPDNIQIPKAPPVPKTWPKYLRILDADASGATRGEMTTEFYSRGTERMIYKDLNEARDLRDHRIRLILPSINGYHVKILGLEITDP